MQNPKTMTDIKLCMSEVEHSLFYRHHSLHYCLGKICQPFKDPLSLGREGGYIYLTYFYIIYKVILYKSDILHW